MSTDTDPAITRLHRFSGWFRPPTETSPAARAAVRGVRVTGSLRDESGWGAAARGYVRALQHLRVPMMVHDVSALTSHRSDDRSPDLPRTEVEADVNLVCVDASEHVALLSQVGESFFAGHYNIGAWPWELPHFPRWYDRVAYYDEIWVGTSFIASTLAPIAPVPVVRIPPVVTAPTGSRERGRQRIRARSGEFVFAFVFDVRSHLTRNNPAAVIEAFRRVFTWQGRIRLVLKSVNAAADPAGYAALRRLAGDAPIDFIDGYWQPQELHDLMAACDAYVSLHRSEGTGLTIAEAMAIGKPVIATDWSGSTDFADASNSFPVAYELTKSPQNAGPYRADETRAEPDVDHAAALMQYVVRNRIDAIRRGENARARMQRDYSDQAIASLVQARLDVIANRERRIALRHERTAFLREYGVLVEAIRRIVSRVVPPGAIVAVVSRGDGDLLTLEHRTGWHFPEARPGVYAGHPANSDAAIAALEEARTRGARFLLFPGTSFWWLEHYDQFRDHLDARYACAWRDPRCVIYDLRAT